MISKMQMETLAIKELSKLSVKLFNTLLLTK